MTEQNQLRIVVQAIGLYTVVHSLGLVAESVSRFIDYRFIEHMEFGTPFESRNPAIMKGILLQPIIAAGLLLFLAWFLLAKTDWCVKAIVDMSRRPATQNPAD